MFTSKQLKMIHTVIRNGLSPQIRSSSELFELAALMERTEDLIDSAAISNKNHDQQKELPKSPEHQHECGHSCVAHEQVDQAFDPDKK